MDAVEIDRAALTVADGNDELRHLIVLLINAFAYEFGQSVDYKRGKWVPLNFFYAKTFQNPDTFKPYPEVFQLHVDEENRTYVSFDPSVRFIMASNGLDVNIINGMA